ncbi:hypothetical protein ASPWEDRAFT_28560 [Aspergillus wentii DTO 134E9]|uniref:BTB domain-containing protein n=1 Tax=Aspergillus wentii DTO 134E9 TaxID=1073089 RepID=A0A1L9RMC1_ASPWE|nr:uncharacterized protein ASPWEDRAFT_28560 [Aspergillus wentii DTO 134E9]OJJ35968.1 hypothetical protein ASPWEDRAFT_28560 [Aspergillus wentii DTO 134E9]
MAVTKEAVQTNQGDRLLSNVQRFLESSKYSDVTIQTKDTKYNVHKLVLSGQSQYFERLFDGYWKEAKEKTIVLHDDNPDVVKAMILFMYGFDYAQRCKSDSALFHASIYCVADKYLLTALKSTAKAKYDAAVERSLLEKTLLHLIPELYNDFPCLDNALRKTVIDICSKYSSYCNEQQEFETVLEQVPEFAIDFALALARKDTKKWTLICCCSCYGNFLAENYQLRCPKCVGP